MGKGESLRKGSQFATVYAQGNTWAGTLVVLKTLPNDIGCNRFGFVAGKRVGKAVERNRIKRLLREIVWSTPMRQGWDIIFIARVKAERVKYQDLDEEVNKLIKKAQIFDNNGRPLRVAER